MFIQVPPINGIFAEKKTISKASSLCRPTISAKQLETLKFTNHPIVQPVRLDVKRLITGDRVNSFPQYRRGIFLTQLSFASSSSASRP